ncbi:hypothetical protein [Oceaniglobus trochenteri]|uniref:hypothetical protein n=1 Tax=Oceaniglobus trochenteri TaxID=2763260 RepID=UPI001CFF988E|nr:hypothetical protein [Oceaniglobus trochenteri]
MAVTHQNGKFYLCTTPQPDILDQSEFEGLTWVEVPNVVEAPSFQITDNMLTENYLSSDIAEKQKGYRSIDDSTLVIGLKTGVMGHTNLVTAARTRSVYAIKYVLDDALNETGTGTTFYARAVIGGGGPNGGGGEEFVRKTFNLGMTEQFPIEVAATAGA